MISEKIEEIEKRIKQIKIEGIEVDTVHSFSIKNSLTDEFEDFLNVFVIKSLGKGRYKTKLITLQYKMDKILNNFPQNLDEIVEDVENEIKRVTLKIK